MSSRYENHKLENLEHLKRIFPDGEADSLNWCILSTSGVHGLYTTLDDIQAGDYEHPSITVLVIMPRVVTMLYGHIDITLDDIPYLRKLVNSSLKYIVESQKNNI